VTSEEQQLTAIESQLCASDPGLAAMFATFTSQPTLRQGPVSERVSPWRTANDPAGDPGAPAAPAERPTGSRVVLVVFLAFLVTACVVAGVMEASDPAWPARVIHSTDLWGTGGYR
jgi:hypothetical protein